MKVILINRRHGGSRSIELGRWSRALLSLCCLGLPLSMVAVGYIAGQDSDARSVRGAALDGLQDELEEPHFHDLDVAVVHRELERLRDIQRPGPSAESILRDIAGADAGARSFE